MRVLLVEDDSTIAASIDLMLRHQAWTIFTTASERGGSRSGQALRL